MTNKKKIMMKVLIVAVMFFGSLLLWTGRVANILAILLCLGCIEFLLLNQLYNEFSSTSKGKKK